MINKNKKVYYERIIPTFTEGIDIDNITPEFSSIVEELICSICSCLCYRPVICKSCEKPFCKYCIDSWLKKKNECPSRCSPFVESELSRPIRNMINKVKVRCVNSGCQEVILYENFDRHLENCKNSLWKCIQPNCIFTGTEEEVKAHSTVCVKEICKYCLKSFPIDEFLRHFSTCDLMAETCNYCSMNITRQNLAEHTPEYCVVTVIKKYEMLLKQKDDQLRIATNQLEESRENFRSQSMMLPNSNGSASNNINNDINKELVMESFISSGVYIYNGRIAGTNKIQDLNDQSLKKGICCIAPGMITITLNGIYSIGSIDLGGYAGDSTIWNPNNGIMASINVSSDGCNWEKVGNIPQTFGNSIIRVNFYKVKACKYIQFCHSNYLGIGYLKLNQDNQNFSNLTNQNQGFQINNSLFPTFSIPGLFSIGGVSRPQTASKEGTPISVEFTPYVFNGLRVGGTGVNDLISSNQTSGGYTGDRKYWFPANGIGAKILTSQDKITWVEVGIIPNLFGEGIIPIDVRPTFGKYIRITHNNYTGLGYLKVTN